jgi:enoyl-CoA hydratase/carnithine racemase
VRQELIVCVATCNHHLGSQSFLDKGVRVPLYKHSEAHQSTQTINSTRKPIAPLFPQAMSYHGLIAVLTPSRRRKRPSPVQAAEQRQYRSTGGVHPRDSSSFARARTAAAHAPNRYAAAARPRARTFLLLLSTWTARCSSEMAPYGPAEAATTVETDLSDAGILAVTAVGGAGGGNDAGSINVVTVGLMGDLVRVFRAAAADDDVRVLVLRSADPDFFLAHFDVAAIGTSVGGPEPERKMGATAHGFHRMCNLVREMAKPCIAEIGGRVGGGGSELCLNFDMRFGVTGKYTMCQMEVPLGILPGGSGTVALPRLIGSGRALEIILSGDDIDAETAERWGILNRAFPDAASMRAHVDALASRLASMPPSAVAAAKASVGTLDTRQTGTPLSLCTLYNSLHHTAVI